MTYQQFTAEWGGKQVTRYGGQCVALVSEFEAENNLPICWANAKDWADNPNMLGAYDWHPGAPNAETPQGSIVVWNSNLPGSGGFGHVDLFDHWTGNGFVGFDQNWGGREAHFQPHNLLDIAGYFTKKEAPVAPAPHPAPVPPAHNTYVVVRGDTLSAIAAKHGETLAHLESLNPQIKNFNLIYPGEVVNIR